MPKKKSKEIVSFILFDFYVHFSQINDSVLVCQKHWGGFILPQIVLAFSNMCQRDITQTSSYNYLSFVTSPQLTPLD